MCIAVVLEVLAPIGNGADEPAAFLGLPVEVSGRERIDLDQLNLLVIKSTALHRAKPACVGLDDVADLEDFLDRDRRLAIRMVPGRLLAPRCHRLRSDIDGGDMHGAGPAVEKGRGRAPWKA